MIGISALSTCLKLKHIDGDHGYTNSVIGKENSYFCISQKKNPFVKFIKYTLKQGESSNVLLPHFCSLLGTHYLFEGIV